jgi:uncharacterized protein (TIGR03437 family)
VQDGARESGRPVSPGKIVAIFGPGVGPSQPVQYKVGRIGQSIGTTLGGTSVSFNGTPPPVLFRSASEVNAIVPYEISDSTAQVTVTYNGQSSATVSLPNASSAPSLFTRNETGAGQAAALHAGGSVNTAANLVKTGGVIWLYATSEGNTSAPGSHGKIASAPLPHLVLPVSVTTDAQTLTVHYAEARRPAESRV